MGSIVLRDGRVLHLSDEQHRKLSLILLMSTRMDKAVVVDEERFVLQDIVTDPEEISKITQVSLAMEVPKLVIHRKQEMDND